MSQPHSYSKTQERKIRAMMPSDLDVAIIASCKIYSTNTKGKEWLYSDLEGLIIFVLDHKNKTRYLMLYDSFSFEKQFQYELYTDFSTYFLTLAPDFRCFEIEGGFIGLQFDLESEATQFEFMLKKFEGHLLLSLFDSRPVNPVHEDKAEKMERYSQVIKAALSIDANYDENYAEDGLEINKPRNFEMLNNICYNRDTKQFEIGEISDELRNVFREAGIRKKDLTNDLNFAFMMFKKIILGVSENKELLSNEYLHKEYPQPDDIAPKKNGDVKGDAMINNSNTTNSTTTAINEGKGNEVLNNSTHSIGLNKSDHSNPKFGVANRVNTSTMNNNNSNSNNSNIAPKTGTKQVQGQNSNNTQSSIGNKNMAHSIKPDASSIKKPSSIKPNINSKIAPPKNPSNRIIKQPGQSNSNSNNDSKQPQVIKAQSNINKQIEQQKEIIEQTTTTTKTNISKPIHEVDNKKLEPIIEEPKTSTINTNTNNNIPSIPSSIPGIPQVPSGNIPLPPPFLGPVFIPNIPISSENNQQKSREDELSSIKLKKVVEEETIAQPSMYEQLKNVKLKAVQKETAQPQKLMTKNEQNFLQNSLAMALQQRRKNLLKHQESDSESDEDW